MEDKSSVRQRLKKPSKEHDANDNPGILSSDTDAVSGDEQKPRESFDVSRTENQRRLESVLSKLPPRWRSWVIRFFVGAIMIFLFVAFISFGFLGICCLVLLIELGMFHEIIVLGHAVYRSHDLAWFRLLSWYFLLTSNFFLFGETLITHFKTLFMREELLQPLVIHHRLISYCMYMTGFVWFVLTLKKRHYMRQFTLFGWTHVCLLMISTSSATHIANALNGMIWFTVPAAIVFTNDIMAYMCGFFFGKTPLIKLSPKKTWEGYIGGGLFTVLIGIILCATLSQYDYFVCPAQNDEPIEGDHLGSALLRYNAFTFNNVTCKRHPVFIPMQFEFPEWMLLGKLRIVTYPIVFHSIVISLFASIIGPFGGFFASGLKRAFKIKDFSVTIPGHGGLLDRFDCHLIVSFFVFVFHESFIRVGDPVRLLHEVNTLRQDEQLEFYRLLTESLQKRGLL